MRGEGMSKKYLLIDFENIQKVDLNKVPGHFHVLIFVGMNQKSMPFDLVSKTQPLGNRLEWKKVQGAGKDALDFYLSYYVGRLCERDKEAECIILSKDKGFDALIKCLVSEGRKCTRIEELKDLK